MRILVLSAYDAGSHKRWRKTLEMGLPDIDWTVLTLAPRHFSWRIRSNPLTWSVKERDVLERPYDLVLATSMVDVATLKGLVSSLAKLPWISYWHENQFAYPQRDLSYNHSPSLLILQIYTALASDRLVFNSEYNRSSFFQGVPRFLKKMPDGVPDGLVERLYQRSEIIPVPLDDCWFTGRSEPRPTFSILWNHRWEYDKAPERLAAALRILEASNVDFEVSLIGQSFRKVPPEFLKIREEFGTRFRHWGYVEDKETYRQILSSSDVVVSTAIHEFQGLAVLEAVAAGCRPVVPDRLAYPEFFSTDHLYASSIDDPTTEAQNLATTLRALAQGAESKPSERPSVDHLRWSKMKNSYLGLFNRVLG